MGLHLFRWERGKYGRDVRRPGTESWIKPLLCLQDVKDHRHTVVNTSQQAIRHGGYDRKAVEHLAIDIAPDIPKAGERKRLFFLQVKPYRKLSVQRRN